MTWPIETEEAMENWLSGAVSEGCGDDVRFMRTFTEDGLLTGDRGLVLGLQDGSEWEIRISQSEPPDGR